MTPMVFCASFAPWPKDTAPAETSWSHLNGLALSGRWNTLRTPATRNIARKAMPKATSGLATIATSVLVTLGHAIASMPPAARPAPTRPPMRAWLEDDGIPTHQVA